MQRSFSTIAIFACCLAACGENGSRNEIGGVRASPPEANKAVNAAQPGNASAANERRRETLTATFAGWEMGDYLWARFEAPGRDPVRAMVEGDANGLFLDAHRGQQVTVEVATVMMDVPEAGGQTEIVRLVSARNASGTAEQWLAALSPAERQAAQRRFDQGTLSGGGR